MEHVQQLKNVFAYYTGHNDMWRILCAQLVDTGKISRYDLLRVFSPNTDIENIAPATLALIYAVMAKANKQLKVPEYFFGSRELVDSRLQMANNTYDNYPLEFENATKVSIQDEYCFCLTYDRICQLSKSKMIRINADMQRESEIVRCGDLEIPHVKFNNEKAKEIKENILNGTQHPNMIRFHLVPDPNKPLSDSFEYDEVKHTLCIKDGTLVNIDGNHRINAIIEAVYENDFIGKQYMMPVMLTIGSPVMAREIIVQEEQRTPINEKHVLSLKQTEGRRIIDALKRDEDFTRYYSFCTTEEQCYSGGGIFIEYIFADAVTKCFHITTPLRKKQVETLADWLAEFLCSYYCIVEEIKPGYINSYYKHREYIMSNEYVAFILMFMAEKLQDESDWESKLEAWVNKLDFTKTNRGRRGRQANLEMKAMSFIQNSIKEETLDA